MSYFSETGINGRLYMITNAVVRSVWIALINFLSTCAYLAWLCLLRPIMWVNFDLYWWLDGYLYRWVVMTVIHWMWSAGYTIAECGENLDDVTEDESLLISNHVTNADVPVLIQWVQKKRKAQNSFMWILDSGYRKTNFGPPCQMRGDFFITQGKETRHLQGPMLRQHLTEKYWPRKRKWMLLFPEGNWLHRHVKKCQDHARKSGWPVLQNCVFPRVGAVQAILDTGTPRGENPCVQAAKRPLKWVIDVTLGYPERNPLHLRTVVGGWRKSCVTTIHCRKYRAEDVPTDAEELRLWLHERYIEKEYMLDIYNEAGEFPDADSIRNKAPLAEVKFEKKRHFKFRKRDFLMTHAFFVGSFFLFASTVYNLCLGLFKLSFLS